VQVFVGKVRERRRAEGGEFLQLSVRDRMVMALPRLSLE